MKYLFFLRHAKSSWKDGDLSDLERPLNERGISDIKLMSEELLNESLAVDKIVSSHSRRTRLTCELLIEHMNWNPDILEFNERLYHAFYYDVIEIIKSTSDKVNKLMLVGHNPTITNFVNKFSVEYIANVPTSGLVILKTDIHSWKDFSQKNAELQNFIFPKMFK